MKLQCSLSWMRESREVHQARMMHQKQQAAVKCQLGMGIASVATLAPARKHRMLKGCRRAVREANCKEQCHNGWGRGIKVQQKVRCISARKIGHFEMRTLAAKIAWSNPTPIVHACHQ